VVPTHNLSVFANTNRIGVIKVITIEKNTHIDWNQKWVTP
jgi:hypothetical protein